MTGEVPPRTDGGSDDEQNDNDPLDDADVQSEVVRRDTGVRLRTNVQAGSASERVNVTLETHAQDLDEMAHRRHDHDDLLRDELVEAKKQARTVNDG